MSKIIFPFIVRLAQLLIDRDNMTFAACNLEDALEENPNGETNAPLAIAVFENKFYLEDGHHRLAKMLCVSEPVILAAEIRVAEENPQSVSETLDYAPLEDWCGNYYETSTAAFPLEIIAVRPSEEYPALVLGTVLKPSKRDLIEMVQHVPEIAPNRRHSVFYSGFPNPVATLKRGNREIEVVVNGDVKMKFEEDGSFYKNFQCAEEAESLNLFDDDIRRLSEKNFIADENWFEFDFRLAPSGEWDFIEQSCEGLYDDAVKEAIKILRDDEFWKDVSGDGIGATAARRAV